MAGTPAAAEGGGAVGGSDIAAQAREALRRIAVALEEAGAGLQDVARTRMFVTDITRWRRCVERFFNRMKNWRGLASRFDKLATVFRGSVILAAIVDWLR